MVNEIETNVCKKKKKRKKGSVSSRVVVRIYVNAIIFSTIANEHWENIGSIILSIDLSIPCFLFFFFSPMRTLKFSAWSLSDVRAILYAFIVFIHTAERCILRFLPSLHFFFSSLVASRVFSLLVSLQLRYFVAIYEYIIWSKRGIRIKYTRVE